MKKLSLLLCLILFCIPSTDIYASRKNGGRWKNGHHWPFLIKPKNREMRKKVKKISREDIERISTDEIVLKENQRFPENMEEIDHGEGALYSLKYISEHYSDGNLMVFRYHYKNADLKTRRYIRQCADMADLFELIGDIK